jgi:hypothetical protein
MKESLKLMKQLENQVWYDVKGESVHKLWLLGELAHIRKAMEEEEWKS